jgi:hypothetical protein
MKIGGSAVSTGLRAPNGGAPSLSTSRLASFPTMYHSPVGSAEDGRVTSDSKFDIPLK